MRPFNWDPEHLYLSASELQQYNQACCQLQQRSYVGDQLLITLCRSCSYGPHYRRIQLEITTVAAWMNLLLELCEDILTRRETQRPDVKLIISSTCKECVENGYMPNTHDRQADGCGLRPDDVWVLQVESLLVHIRQAMRYLFAHTDYSSRLKHFPDCLRTLSRAVIRQRQHLEQIGAREAKIEVECRPHQCSRCGREV